MEWLPSQVGDTILGTLVRSNHDVGVKLRPPSLNNGLGTSSGSSLMEEISHLLPEQPALSTEEMRSTRPGPSRLRTSGHSGSLIIDRNLADAHLIGRLVDAYFLCYNSSYPILHELTFRGKYEIRCQIHESSSWHTIFYAVLAIGSWILGVETEPKAYDFYAAARSHMSLRMLEVGNLLTVQAFLLMVRLAL
jgi:transcriptional regulatory protein GAL4